MKRLPWLLRRHAVAVALCGGALLVAAALGLHWLVVRPLAQRVEALQAQREEPPAVGASQRQGDALARPESPRALLDAFYRHFERGDHLTDRLGRVHEIAGRLGLEIKRADYRLESQIGRRLDRYRMTVPLQGSYPSTRAFVSTVLRELPTVSLEQVQFERQDVADGNVEAQVSFIFYLKR